MGEIETQRRTDEAGSRAAHGSGDIASLAKSDSITDKLKMLKDTGGAMAQVVYRDAADTPIAAAIFVFGEATPEILEAVKDVEDMWE